MKIRCLVKINGAIPGSEIDLPAEKAKALIKRRLAVAVKSSPKKSEPKAEEKGE